MKKSKILLLLTVLLFAVSSWGKTVKASSFGFNAADATEALQKAFDSGASKVIVDYTGKDWITRPLFIRNKKNLEIVFEKNVTLRAKKGAFKRRTDSLLEIRSSRNIKLTGNKNVLFIMNKKDYDNPKLYRHAEWRHCISLRAAENIEIRDLMLKSSGGDGIYLAGDGKKNSNTFCKNILIENVICDDHYRQGASFISAENVIMRNCKFLNTSGTAPQCGIDFEPNRPTQRFVNILLENCDFDNNTASGIMFYVRGMKASSPSLSVTIRNCRFRGNSCGLTIASTDVKGWIKLEKCLFENNKHNTFLFRGQKKNLKVIMKDVTVNALPEKKTPPFVITGDDADLGNIELDNLKIITQAPYPIELITMTGYGLLPTFKGTLFYGKKADKLRSFNLKKFVSARPPRPDLRLSEPPRKFLVKDLHVSGAPIVVPKHPIWFRSRLEFVQSVPKAGVWPIRFKAWKLGPANRKFRMTGIVSDQNGAVWDQFSTDKEDFVYNLKVKSNGGKFHFALRFHNHGLQLFPVGNGQTIITNRLTRLFKGRNYRFYFTVPAKAEYAAVMASAYVAEPADVELLNAAGKVVKSIKKIKGNTYIKFPRKPTAKDEIWSIRFPWAEEDYAFMICPPSLPLAATSPANLMRE